MKPVELVVEGFGPFRDRTVIDFTDTGFFALIGPTGAGKSSVIDAICFALYGMVPRYDDKRLVAPSITTGAQEARIQFRFEVAGRQYVAVRVVRRRGEGATTKECRLQVTDDSGAVQVLAGDAASATAQVSELLGLTPEHFTRCVVLPQGEFARFLHDKPADRQKLLVELLGLEVYGQMASQARVRAGNAATRADALVEQLRDLSAADPQARAAAAARVASMAALMAQCEAAGPRVAAAHRVADEAAAELASRQSLATLLAAISVPAAVAELGTALARAQSDLVAAQDAAAAAEAAAQLAEAESRAAPDTAALQEIVGRWRSLSAESAKLPTARERAAAAQAGLTAAREALAAAELASQRAADRVRELERVHSAHALAADLVAGQDCPVCGQSVVRVPERALPADLEQARAAAAAQAREVPAWRTVESRAATAQATAEAELHDLEARCAQLREELAEAPSEAAALAGLEQARVLRQRADDLRAQASDAQRGRAAAATTVEGVRSQQHRHFGSYTKQRDAVSVLGPPAPSGALGSDWRDLAEWARTQQDELARQIAQLERVRSERLAEVADIVARLLAAAQQDGVAVGAGSSFQEVAAAATRAHDRAESQLEAILRDLEKAERMRAERDQLRVQAELAETMGRLLSARGFEQWILAEALSQLVTGASHTLRELSQGAYSLTLGANQEFLVIDHQEADTTRPARTLSGGETFQASLALALALADHLGQFAVGGAARLESIFLDEGFGTLDEDSLEVVAATLETLASGTRMVGLVTHVKELAARVPVRFEVRKSGRTSVVERVGP